MFSSSRHKFELLLGSQLRFVLRRNIPQALPPYILKNDFEEKKTHQVSEVSAPVRCTAGTTVLCLGQ
jgi:hypothetical protein